MVMNHDGSSPRSWGTLYRLLRRSGRSRFIPTLVGNTTKSAWGSRSTAVHPHARGEHSMPTDAAGTTCGSSPRSWGTPPPTTCHGPNCRFIPTLVGNTRRCRQSRDQTAVHPHARGEHKNGATDTVHLYGSSPRSWGTRCADDPAACEHRFIPTLVGNTLVHRSRQRLRSVHPHARGEHLRVADTGLAAYGSSPRSWGTPPRARRCSRACRFIPTLVGNTIAQRRTC